MRKFSFMFALLLVLATIISVVSCEYTDGGGSDNAPDGMQGDAPGDGVHVHFYQTIWSADTGYHWHAAACEHPSEVKDRAPHSFNEAGVCTVCGYIRTTAPHTHTFSGDWTYDETIHWHAATCGHAEVISGVGLHTYENGVCTTCGKVLPHTHTFSDDWMYNENMHWHAATCDHSEVIGGAALHTYENGVCTVCGYCADLGQNVDFGGMQLTIQLSDNDTDPELPAVKEYIEGPDNRTGETGVDKVKNAVYERNNDVKSKRNGLNVTLKYVYTKVEGYSDYWSHVAPVIASSEENYSAADDKPDLYIELMYDMMSVACEKAVFDNILKYTKNNDAGLSNYVGGYFDITKANGYNTALMDDMTLTSNRQVLLASDYFLDVIRAMLVLPFNLNIYKGYATNDADAAKLYELVMDGKWTWDQLMSYKGVASNSGQATLEDTTLLMAVANGGMMASGLLYSTDYSIYRQNGDSYKLKDTCSALQGLFQKAADLARTGGVVVVRGESVAVTTVNAKFVSGGALFATVNMLGILETEDFQGMMASGALSVLPVPKYEEVYDYSTLTNSRARVGALSYHSANQVAMSAYVQLSTERSGIVRDTYFREVILGEDLAGSGAGFVLNMIYVLLGNAKNVILENLILSKDWNIGKDNCWAQLIKVDNLTGNENIQSKMASCVSAKQTILNDAVSSWAAADLAE